MPNHHDVEIRWDGENALSSPVTELVIGDTVQFFSNDGEASVEFPGESPFKEKLIGDRQTVIVENFGDNFRGRCFITRNGNKVGWKDESSPAGFDPHIPPPKGKAAR